METFSASLAICAGNYQSRWIPRTGQWRRALTFSLVCVWINYWVNNREAGDLRRYRAHYDVIVMIMKWPGSYYQFYCRNIIKQTVSIIMNKLENATTQHNKMILIFYATNFKCGKQWCFAGFWEKMCWYDGRKNNQAVNPLRSWQM